MKTKTFFLVVGLLAILANHAIAQRRGPTQMSAEHWARGIQHPEARIRAESFNQLQRLVNQGESIKGAVPVLKQCMARQIMFPTMEEVTRWQKRSMELLAVAEPDHVARPLAQMLATMNVPHESYNAFYTVEILEKINKISVDIDATLVLALGRVQAMNRQEQLRMKRYEGKVLNVLARLGKDRDKVAKVVLSRMRWPLALDSSNASCYTKDHFRAVRLCAKHCSQLLPALKAADKMNQQRDDALVMIGALAVYNDDAWNYMIEKMQDPFTTKYQWLMLTAYADSWLLASEETQKATMHRIKELNEKIPEWGRVRTHSTSRVPRLMAAEDGTVDHETDVMRLFRERVGYTPPSNLGRPKRGR